MKKSLRIIISIMMALALIISCSSEPETASGTLKVDVSSSITKGINPQIDLETANYRLVVTDSSENVKSFDIGTMTSAEESFPAGSYSVKAYAENKDKIVIGESEEESFSIYPNRTTSVSLDITEKAGNGSITISFAGLDVFEEGTTFSVSFREGIGGSLNGEAVKTASLSFNGDGTASASATLKNGFYAIFLESSDDAADLFLDTVRIVSGDKLSASYSFEFSGDGSVTITNSIAKPPTISVEKSGEELPIVLTSTIDNLDGSASYAWYMDGKALSGANGKVLTITAESGIEAGSHEFMLLVISNTGIVWSSDAVVLSIGGEDANVLNIDASNLDDSLMAINKDTAITISNMDPESLYAIQIDKASTKSISSKAINGSSTLTEVNGEYIPTADKNGTFKFTGSDINVKEGKIKVVNIKETQEMAIDTRDKEMMLYQDEDGWEYYKAYYKINLNKLKQDGVDLSRLIIDMLHMGIGSASGSTNMGLFTTHGGVIKSEKTVRGLIDLSNENHAKIFNYASVKWLREGSFWYNKIIVTNPKEIDLESPMDLFGCANYLYVSKAEDPEKEYYIKLTKNTELGDVYQNVWRNEVSEFVDGKTHSFLFPLEETNEELKLYLGTIEEDLILPIKLLDMNIQDSDYVGSIEIVELTEEDKEKYIHTFDIKCGTNTFLLDNSNAYRNKCYLIDTDIADLRAGLTIEQTVYNANGEIDSENISSLKIVLRHTYGYGYSQRTVSNLAIYDSTTEKERNNLLDYIRLHSFMLSDDQQLEIKIDTNCTTSTSISGTGINKILLIECEEHGSATSANYFDGDWEFSIPPLFRGDEGETQKVFLKFSNNLITRVFDEYGDYTPEENNCVWDGSNIAITISVDTGDSIIPVDVKMNVYEDSFSDDFFNADFTFIVQGSTMREPDTNVKVTRRTL